MGGGGGHSPTEVRLERAACLILRTEAGSGGEGPFIVIVVVVIIIAAVTTNNNNHLFSFLILYPPSSYSTIELKLFKTSLNISHFLLWCLNEGL